MNRLAPPTVLNAKPAWSQPEHAPTGQNPFTWPTSSAEQETQHATFCPIHYESGYAYPLIVWLHGAGGSEDDLRQVMPLVSVRNFVAVAPRGTVRYSGSKGLYAWDQSAEGIERSEQRVMEAVAAAGERFHIHPRRIFLAGYDSGGTMALRIAWNNPSRIAGAASFGGPIPRGGRPLRNVNLLRNMRLLLASGRSSRRYSEQQVCRDLRLLHAAGFTVALRQYPCADELTTSMLSDLNHWAMESVCSSQESPAREGKSIR